MSRRHVFVRILFALLLSMVIVAGCGGARGPQDPELIQKAQNLAAQGSHWYNRGCFDRAEQFFYQAMETSRLLDDTAMVLQARNNLGATNLAMKRYDVAGEHLHKALELTRVVNAPGQKSLILGNLAGIAYRTGNKADAETLWRSAIETAESAPNQTGLGLHLNNLGMLMRTTGRLDDAQTLLDRALELAKGKLGLGAGVHHQLGLLAAARGNHDAAEEHLKTALALDKTAENPFGVASDLEQLGLLYQSQKRFDEAAAELDRAIFLRSTLDQQAEVKELYKALKRNHDQSARPESMSPYDDLLDKMDKGQVESILCR